MKPVLDSIILAVCTFVSITCAAFTGTYLHHRLIDVDAPRLVGYGCVGAGGPLFADEEDHFPQCEYIDANIPMVRNWADDEYRD